ncbi:hypothetical protein BDW22DRAFT_1363449 [Trametopsis cervina]|nr:hypothetical protein BDW22DRAFT_1363449 [Trametopsis cervina]
MGFLNGWFRKSQPEDYEQVLAALASDIQKRQTHLSEIRLRERRATLLFSVYALALWIAYVSMWYTGFLPSLSGYARGSNVQMLVEGLPVFIGPIVILFIRRIVQIWYTRIGDKEEKHLVTLRKQQREKIEEIKKNTNYYSTRTLIERYDEGIPVSGVDSPLRRRAPPNANGPSTPQKPQPQQSQPHQPQAPIQLMTPQTPVNAKGQLPPGLQQQLSPSPQRPMPPPRKQWYDRLADAILGDEDTVPGSVASRYALICQKCFTHNGLVKESLWDTTQYVCRSCGHFNPSPKAARRSSPSPASPSRASRTPSRTAGVFAPPLEQPVSMQSDPKPQAVQKSRKSKVVSSHENGDGEHTMVMDVDADS